MRFPFANASVEVLRVGPDENAYAVTCNAQVSHVISGERTICSGYELAMGSIMVRAASAGAMGDIHLLLPGGGQCDMRGVPGRSYALLDTPRMRIAMRPAESVFRLRNATANGRYLRDVRINGTFVHQMHIRVDEDDVVLTAEWTHDKAVLTVTDDSGRATRTNDATVSVTGADWTVTVAARPVYGFVVGATRARIDFEVRPRVRVDRNAGGILGEAYGRGKITRGCMDAYPAYGNFTSACECEGALVGLLSDYEVDVQTWSWRRDPSTRSALPSVAAQ